MLTAIIPKTRERPAGTFMENEIYNTIINLAQQVAKLTELYNEQKIQINAIAEAVKINTEIVTLIKNIAKIFHVIAWCLTFSISAHPFLVSLAVKLFN